jgi:hypothetical protein
MPTGLLLTEVIITEFIRCSFICFVAVRTVSDSETVAAPLPSVIKVPKVGLNIRSQNVSIKLDFPETDAPTILRQEWYQCDGREKLREKQ